MLIELYTRETCKHCIQAKKFLSDNNIEYKEYLIGKDITREQVLEKFPGAKQLPLVIIDDVWIGSTDQLKYIVENNNDKQCGCGLS